MCYKWRLCFFQSQDGAKRLKLSDSSVSTAAAAGVVTNVAKPGGIRRSTRHRKLRGEKALIVSANQTLKELKIQVRNSDYWTQSSEWASLTRLNPLCLSLSRSCTPSLWLHLTKISSLMEKVWQMTQPHWVAWESSRRASSVWRYTSVSSSWHNNR